MNWILFSLLMFLSSVALYLYVRKSAKKGYPSQFNNLAMFLVPLVVFIGIDIFTRQNMMLSISQLLIIVVAAVLFSYLGSVFSLKSIEYAPNPGYSLVISKSYVVFTTITAIVLFHAEISIRKAIAILLIVAFSGLIMLSKEVVHKRANNLWLPLSIGAFFCWGLLSLTSKYLFSQGVSVYVFLTYVIFIASLCISLEMVKKRMRLNIIKEDFKTFLLIGIFSTGFNFFLFQAIKLAPNVGYVNAINASSISAVTVLAVLFFKDEFSKRKFVGVLGVTVGLLLLLL